MYVGVAPLPRKGFGAYVYRFTPCLQVDDWSMCSRGINVAFDMICNCLI